MQDPQTKTWRFHLLFAVPVAALMLLGGKAVHLERCHGSELLEVAQRQQRRRVFLPARPGDIRARARNELVLLAGSRQAPACYADPALLGEENFADVARKVAAIVGARPEDIHRKLTEARDRQFVYLARDLGPTEEQAVRALKMRAVQITHEWRRHYPMGSLAAHVLGFRRIDGVPGGGVELKADRWLAATAGVKVLRMDVAGRGRYARVEEYRPPTDGKHVVLTIDVMVQSFLERALADTVEQYGAEAGMGVVMDPNTGEILAMASVPTFDPNRYMSASADQRRNRAITDPYEPGSVFKALIAAGAVQMGKATLQTELFCHNGDFRAPRGGRIGEYSRGFGTIPMTTALIKSSNIFMAKLGLMLGKESLFRIGQAYGFGTRTGVQLPGECPGRLVPVRRWTTYATPRMPFGQGPITLTTLQLARAFSVIANGGELLTPRIIDRVLDSDGREVHRGERRRVHRVLSRRVARDMIEQVLVKVVEEGTGKRARLEKWRVFGKTGTAQIGGPGGYEERAYTASFVAGAPATEPALVCAVSIYRPDCSKGYTGGVIAAPCVKEVLGKALWYLDVPGDRAEALAGADGLAGR